MIEWASWMYGYFTGIAFVLITMPFFIRWFFRHNINKFVNNIIQ